MFLPNIPWIYCVCMNAHYQWVWSSEWKELCLNTLTRNSASAEVIYCDHLAVNRGWKRKKANRTRSLVSVERHCWRKAWAARGTVPRKRLQLGCAWGSCAKALLGICWGILIMNLVQGFLAESTETQLIASKTTTPESSFKSNPYEEMHLPTSPLRSWCMLGTLLALWKMFMWPLDINWFLLQNYSTQWLSGLLLIPLFG